MGDGRIGVTRVAAAADDDVQDDDEIEEVNIFLAELRQRLSMLGYRLIDIDTSPTNVRNHQYEAEFQYAQLSGRGVMQHADLTHFENCAIRHRGLCSAASPEALAELNRIAHPHHYRTGQTIISEDVPVDFVANVVSGIVKLTKTMPDGRQQIVGLLFPFDFVGQAFAGSMAFSTEAASDVELVLLNRKTFEAIVDRHPDLKQQLLLSTLNELDAAREWMLLLGSKSADEKVASFLMQLVRRSFNMACRQEAQLTDPIFELPVNRADIAGYLGMTVETVSRQISRMKAERIIKLIDVHHYTVPNLNRLADLAGQEPPVWA
jgi:CRP/FNR family transcriptional regulator